MLAHRAAGEGATIPEGATVKAVKLWLSRVTVELRIIGGR